MMPLIRWEKEVNIVTGESFVDGKTLQIEDMMFLLMSC